MCEIGQETLSSDSKLHNVVLMEHFSLAKYVCNAEILEIDDCRALGVGWAVRRLGRVMRLG